MKPTVRLDSNRFERLGIESARIRFERARSTDSSANQFRFQPVLTGSLHSGSSSHGSVGSGFGVRFRRFRL